jgi:superfamily II DNA or RNA helicase
MFESMIVGVSMEELIAEGWLVQPIVYAPPLPVDYSRVRRMKNGEYEDKELEKLLDQRAVTGCAIQHYKNICDGVPAVAFCTSVDHAIHVAMEFNRAGISAREIHGKQSKIERKRILADFKAGAIKVLTSCELISEGFDLPSVGAAILLRPTDSLSLYLQQVGRALRADDGKEFAFILDHVGNCFQHGLPDDARLWSLEGKEKRLAMSKTPAVRQCPKCYAAFAPAQNCPVCGFALEVQTRRTQDIEVREGELKPVDEIAKKRAIKAEELKRRASQCKSLDDLRALGESLGYKPKWAEMRWRARQARLQSRGIGR